jgi:hypothetical protein
MLDHCDDFNHDAKVGRIIPSTMKFFDLLKSRKMTNFHPVVTSTICLIGSLGKSLRINLGKHLTDYKQKPTKLSKLLTGHMQKPVKRNRVDPRESQPCHVCWNGK